MRGRKSLIRLALSTLCLFAVTVTIALLAANNVETAKANVPADAMWVEPLVLNFSIYEVNVGYRFNVTIWVNVTSQHMFAWQFRLYYNTSHLQATKAGYTGPNGANSEWATHRTGGTVATVVPVIEANYVMITESCQGDYYVPKGTCASLAWVEFNVTAVPPLGGQLESLLDINNARTWVERFPDLEEIPITKYSAEYIVIPEFTSPIIYVTALAIVSMAASTKFRKKLKT